MPLVATLVSSRADPQVGDALVARATHALGGAARRTLSPGVAVDLEVPAALSVVEAEARLREAVDGRPVDVAVLPAGGRRKRLPKLYSRDEIHNASLLLHGAEIVLADFGDVLDQARPGDFVYLDPPYFPVSATANFTSYTRLDFPAEQQQRLADWLHTLDQRGVAFLLNNSDTPFTREIYAGFPIDVALAKRMINSDAGKRGAVNELIVYNVT